MILCLDYGERYVGMAIADPTEKIALRYKTLDRKKEEIYATLLTIIAAEKIETIVVGLPVGLSGKKTEQTNYTLHFIEALQAQIPEHVNVVTVNELLSSKEASQHIQAEGGNPEDVHAEAARLILQDFLRREQ